jgi:hypothetical protein
LHVDVEASGVILSQTYHALPAEPGQEQSVRRPDAVLRASPAMFLLSDNTVHGKRLTVFSGI